MPANVFEVSSSIIFPRSTGLSDGSVVVNISPPAPSNPRSRSPLPPSEAEIKSGPENPIYRLPQSLSSGGLKIHLNDYVPSRKIDINRRSAYSSIDEDHIIYEISKASLGEAAVDYVMTNFLFDPSEGGYGRGTIKFTPGWISGGTWVVSYRTKKPGQVQEQRIDLKFDEGGKEDKVWKMTFPMEGVVARELKQPDGMWGENGRALEIVEGGCGIEGWSDKEWRDFLMAAFIAKVWRDCTSTPWMGASVRTGEAKSLSTW